ncbi:hypothetical protein K435DRAFT_779492 [Dendrothele bispora CBS 962.96]|uniref:Uncharacterized protein n=1 Tax=Dendrothele bispora (strain CBS 962.96) TaxID=1314807 RepID=A0A4S8LXG2_DENBC|nr:hypothetical protein K435DRAFT_780993 [Dendrothele bispora CBS 962.96]THU94210.1 hypothetical protein K435DRAFT_779492 [Dendrothele bispora CBS 962.96]
MHSIAQQVVQSGVDMKNFTEGETLDPSYLLSCLSYHHLVSLVYRLAVTTLSPISM